MVKINEEKCIGCAACVKECFPRNITIEKSKARILRENCMQCGHCVAICPTNAVEITDYDMNDVIEAAPQPFTPEELLSFIKTRRSIRQYTDRGVEHDLLKQIIEAGRYTATAANRQALSFIVVEKEMETFRRLVIESLAEQSRGYLANNNIPMSKRGYHQFFIDVERAYIKNPNEKDHIFFGAPVVILITGDSPIDAGLAASNMELVACASGLGVLYSGFIARGTGNATVKSTIGVPDEKEILIALVIGHPDVQFLRSAPRKTANILWS